jgi:hypothetical protein
MLMWPGVASGQASMQLVLSNGPAPNRFNIAVLSEGYTAGQLDSFNNHASNIVSALLDHPPFSEYRGFFNAFAISVPSSQSGSDHPASGITVNTYFNSSYDLYDRIVTLTNTSQGQGRVDALVQSFLPACHLAIVLVNDMIPAGSDGGGKSAVVSIGNSLTFMSDILAHEVGHVMAGLGDEYEAAFPGYPDTEEPNTTRETRRDFIKWKSWIASETPLPTPPWLGYSETVGLFEGAHYHATGWYRPRLNCAMRDNVSLFCEVCAQSLVLALHAKVRLADHYSPAGTNLLVSSDQPVGFSIELLRPSNHELAVQWFTNGTPVPAIPGGSFALSPALLRDGTNSVSVLIADNTPLVRDDPMGSLRETNAWIVTVDFPRLRLESPLLLADGRFAFKASGAAQNGFVVLTSTNLLNWVPLSTNFLVNGQLWCTNAPSNGSAPHYYRAATR